VVLLKGAAVQVSVWTVANHDRLVAVSVSVVRVRDAMVPVSGAGEPARVAVVAVSVALVAMSVALVAMSVAAMAAAVRSRRAGAYRGRLHEGGNPSQVDASRVHVTLQSRTPPSPRWSSKE